MNGIKSAFRRAAAWIGTHVMVFAVRLLLVTCRNVAHLHTPYSCPYQRRRGDRYLFSVWHDQIVCVMFGRRCHGLAALVSQHRDGGYLASAMASMGIQPIRGSSSRGGSAALREMLQAVQDRDVAITPDGPRGPRREMKDGIIFLASRTGRGIIPAVSRASSCWRIKGRWTDMIIPKPFSTVVLFLGEPYFVPKRIRRDEFPGHVAELQRRMDELNALVESTPAGRAPIWPESISQPHRIAA